MSRFIIISCCIVTVLLTGCRDQNGLVVGKIKKASELATTEFTIDKIVYGVKRKKLLWLINLKEAKFIAYSRAYVKAGIDLEKLKAEDVAISDKRIKLTLPPVHVINFSYPAEQFLKDESISHDALFNKTGLPEQEDYFLDAETDIRNSLRNMGIAAITEKKTAQMLDNLLRALGYEEIYIDFHTGELIPEINPEP